MRSVIDKNQNRFVSEHCDSLTRLSGSRSFWWKVFLGLIPDTNEKDKWIQSLQTHRDLFNKKMSAVLVFKNKQEQKNDEMAPLMNLRW